MMDPIVGPVRVSDDGKTNAREFDAKSTLKGLRIECGRQTPVRFKREQGLHSHAFHLPFAIFTCQSWSDVYEIPVS